MIHGKNHFSKILVLVAVILGYDNYHTNTNTGHGSRGLGITLAAKSKCSLPTLQTFARHKDLKETVNYAKGDEANRMLAAAAV